MRVQYQNTLEELQQLLRLFPLWQRMWWQYGMMFVVVLPSCLPASLLVLVVAGWQGLAASWALVTACIGYVLIANRGAASAGNPKALRPMSITIEPEYVELQSDLGWSRRDWSLIHQVVVSADHIRLFQSALEFHAIPKRVFASAEEAEQFAETARRYWQESQSASKPRFAPTEPPTVEPEGTSAPMLNVRFQCTPHELVDVATGGLHQPGQKRPSAVSKWIHVLLGIVGSLFLFLWIEDMGWLIGLLCSMAAFVLLSLSFGVLMGPIQRVILRMNVPDYRLLPHQLVISPTAVAYQTPRSIAWALWTSYDQVEQDERFVVFYYSKPHIAQVIPKSAFNSPADAQQFGDAAIAFHETALTPADSEPLDAIVLETGNPYQSPRTE